MTDHLAKCQCGHTAAQHHPARLTTRCRACPQCEVFALQEIKA